MKEKIAKKAEEAKANSGENEEGTTLMLEEDELLMKITAENLPKKMKRWKKWIDNRDRAPLALRLKFIEKKIEMLENDEVIKPAKPAEPTE